MTVSGSTSSSESLSLFFDFSFVFFFSVRFVPLYDLYVVSEKKTYKLFAIFLTINFYVMRGIYIVNVTYVVNDDRALFAKRKHVK